MQITIVTIIIIVYPLDGDKDQQAGNCAAYFELHSERSVQRQADKEHRKSQAVEELSAVLYTGTKINTSLH